MPKRIPSTIQIAAHLAQDYIENRFVNNQEEEENEGASNIFETLQNDLNSRVSELKREVPEDEEAAQKNESLQFILGSMADALERGINSSHNLSRTANTEVAHSIIIDGKGNVEEHDFGYNYGAIHSAQKDLHETASELKEFKKNLDILQRDFPEEMEKPYMQDFMAGFNVKQIENGDKILKNCGETKSAYDWIENSKQKLHSSDFIDELDAGLHIARIIAARQLSGAERKNTDALKTTSMTEGELDARAHELLENPAFSTYLASLGISEIPNYGVDESRNEFNIPLPDKNKPYLKFFGSRSHGGALEEDFRKYLNKRPDVEDLPEEIFGRYQEKTEEKYDSYSHYILQNGTSYGVAGPSALEIELNEEKAFTVHDAARMAAAYQLAAEDELKHKFKPGKFQEKRLENLANKLEKTPEFRLALRQPGAMNALKYGKPDKFVDNFKSLQNKFRTITDEADVSVEGEDGAVKEGTVSRNVLTQDAMKKLYRKLLGPSDDPREQEKYVQNGSKKYQTMVKAVKDFVEKAPEDLTTEDRLKVFAATTNYQEGREKKRFFQSGQDRFDLSLQIGKAAVAGTFATEVFRNQIDYINGLRGEPGPLQSDTRISEESVRDYVTEEKTIAARNLPEKEEQEELQMNI